MILRKASFLLIPAIILVVAVTAFGLGRLSVLEAERPQAEILYDQKP